MSLSKRMTLSFLDIRYTSVPLKIDRTARAKQIIEHTSVATNASVVSTSGSSRPASDMHMLPAASNGCLYLFFGRQNLIVGSALGSLVRSLGPERLNKVRKVNVMVSSLSVKLTGPGIATPLFAGVTTDPSLPPSLIHIAIVSLYRCIIDEPGGKHTAADLCSARVFFVPELGL